MLFLIGTEDTVFDISVMTLIFASPIAAFLLADRLAFQRLRERKQRLFGKCLLQALIIGMGWIGAVISAVSRI